MSTALTLVVLIASGDARDPAAIALVRAARQALGAETRVVVREMSAALDDEQAITLGRALRADAVVEVAWKDAEHRRAMLRVHAEQTSRWIDREIGFDAGDADQERGRTIGFALASMLPDQGDGTPGREAGAAAGADLPLEDVPARPRVVALDALAVGSTGVRGYADGGGGALRAAWYAGPRFAVRGGGSVRAGSLGPADATSLTVSASLGVGWRALVPSARTPFGAGLRADVLLVRDSVQRRAGGVESRWLPGVDAAIEGSFRVADPLSLVVAAGAEIAFGATSVFVGGQEVAAIPPLRLIGEAGIRLEF